MTLETRFNVGDKIWTIFKNRPQEMKVAKIVIRIYKDIVSFDYFLNTKDQNDPTFEVAENYVFASKADLLTFWS